jgi:hypothetical protein
MASKKDRLLERAHATAPRPNPERLKDKETDKRGYRVVPASLYTPEADWVDETTEVLRSAGNPKANRSMVIREAIYSLQERLKEKTPDEVLQYFIERHRKAG